MSEVEGGLLEPEKRLAQYILDSDTERDAYNEVIQGGGNPRDTIWYLALVIVGAEDEAAADIEEYDRGEREFPISSDSYVSSGGSVCPACGSGAISADHPEVDGAAMWADVRCYDCSAIWTDYYKLAGYYNLRTGE